jgi:hypothetical protein
MPTWLVFLVYGLAFSLAVYMDYRFPRIGWHWRAVAICFALAIGFTPPSAALNGPEFDLLVGSVFTFLFVWGISEAFFRLFRLPHHTTRRHA